MLLRTIVLVAFVAALGEAIVYGSAALARMAFHAREHAAVRTAFAAAVSQAQSAAATGTIPAPSATCAYQSDQHCVITVKTTIAAATAVPGATPSACPSTDCTVYMQNNSNVAESRVNYAITEQVLAQNGDVILSRSASVAFRTFAEAPYASLVGSLDQTLDAIQNAGVSDDGGNTAASGSTLIHVQYQQSGTSNRVPGDVWRSQDEHPATAAPGWDN